MKGRRECIKAAIDREEESEKQQDVECDEGRNKKGRAAQGVFYMGTCKVWARWRGRDSEKEDNDQEKKKEKDLRRVSAFQNLTCIGKFA